MKQPTHLCLAGFSLLLLTGIALADSPSPQAAATNGPAIRLNRKGNDGPVFFEVTGLDAADLERLAKIKPGPEQWARLFHVHVEEPGTTAVADRPALVGSYRIEDGTVRFEPRFPLVAGLSYRAVFEPAQLPGPDRKAAAVTAHLAVPKQARLPSTVVSQVYPTAGKLPENQLKFYLSFSAPMSRGQSYRHLRLLDAAGKPVEEAFLELEQELWDADEKRFTLFIHPGRIKRGLKPREELGPVLELGKSYTLEIDAGWLDAQGEPLKATYRKKFDVIAPDENPPDPKTWKLMAPAAGKTEPLAVVFPKPLDYALLHRLVWVTDASGRKVAGAVTLADQERRWHFTPDQPWRAGAYHLVIDTRLEDLAGNQLGRPFEIDVFHPIEREVKSETVGLAFVVRAP